MRAGGGREVALYFVLPRRQWRAGTLPACSVISRGVKWFASEGRKWRVKGGRLSERKHLARAIIPALSIHRSSDRNFHRESRRLCLGNGFNFTCALCARLFSSALRARFEPATLKRSRDALRVSFTGRLSGLYLPRIVFGNSIVH